ncbi:MAG: hypothetical protein JKY52_17505 [Flavobacteriales bacterium]|nr:hypothetical protein [Flavobacteriales bacterium]
MSTKTNTIEALTNSVTNALGEIVSLKQTCKQHEDTIAVLNKTKRDLSLEIGDTKHENAMLKEEIDSLNKELYSHEELVKKLEGEYKKLADSVKTLEKGKTGKESEEAAHV